MMLSLRDFWRRHRRKVFVTVGIVGSGYAFYRLYFAHKERLDALEREFEGQREADEHIKAQLQLHFENIQRISDSATLPYVLRNLRSRLFEELDFSQLMERLMHGKGQPNILTSQEKLELWERLKILSFTRTASSLWATTILNLYIRVQVNILGRHLYVDTARGLEISFSQHLRDPFTMADLHDTFARMLQSFMSGPHHWVNYIVPETASAYKELTPASSHIGESLHPSATGKLEQLVVETRAVLASDDFSRVAEIALKNVTDGVMEEVRPHFDGGSSNGIPLAKILARVAQLSSDLLEEPSRNRYIHIIRSLPEVELFYRLLYANMPLAP
ncbi:hypothetical protein AMTRI_Chr13g118910 [Amborella trichopoda]